MPHAEGYSEDSSEASIEEAVQQAQAASVALIFAGLPESYESEGWDRTHLDMPDSHNTLIQAVAAVQPNTVVVLHNGSPVTMPWLDSVKVVLEIGLGGQAVGSAVVDVLSGAVNPSGKLAETFPVRLEDTPAFLNYPGEAGVVNYAEGLFVGYRYYDVRGIQPLFPFGYSLSYTTFEYTAISVSSAEIRAGETLRVSVTLRNTGTRAGKEVVQLYLQPLASAYQRPVKELKAFAKAALEAGETKTIELTLTERDFKVYDMERQAWRMEGGMYHILVGGCSDSLPLCAEVTVIEDPASARRIFNRMTQLKYFMADPVGGPLVDKFFAGTWVEYVMREQQGMFLAVPLAKLAAFTQFSDADVETLVETVNGAV